MSAVLVVALSVGGLALAGRWTVRAWGAERPPRVEADSAARVGRWVPVLRRASALSAAGLVAGVLVLGTGLRLMMRLAAATSPDTAQGRITEADEVVGEVTLGGTFFLVVGVGVFVGMVTMAVWVVLRPWLPRRSAAAGMVLAGIGGGGFARGAGLIDPENRDFVILSPAWLAVVLALVVLVAYGVTFAVLADRWAATWPTPALTRVGIVATLPYLLLVVLGVLLVVPAVIIAVMTAGAVWPRGPADRRPGWMGHTERLGRVLVAAGAVVGGAWMAVSAIQVVRL